MVKAFLHGLAALCLSACSTLPDAAVQKALDRGEIENLMGRYVHYSMAAQWSEVEALYAKKSDDVRQTLPFAVTVGPEALRAYFDSRPPGKPGAMRQNTLASPVIEIAGDGRTAKGVWDSPGHETASGDGPAMWAWVKYGVDFTREDGRWRIWHLRVYPVFRTPYERSWVETAKAAAAGASAVAPGAPRPAGTVYDGRGAAPWEPAPPRPYQTFDPKDAYL